MAGQRKPPARKAPAERGKTFVSSRLRRMDFDPFAATKRE